MSRRQPGFRATILLLTVLQSCNWSFVGAFLTQNAGNDETLTMAFQAIQELSSKVDQLTTENEQLRDRLQSLETTQTTHTQTVTQTLSQVQTNVASLGSRVNSDFIWTPNDWILAFRATQGIGQPVYDAWVNKGHHDDDPMIRATLPCGCTTVNGSLPCDRHYRSRLLDTWPSASIDEVKLAVYENGVEKEHVTFLGTGSDYLNWFSQSRIVDSSWTDLKAATGLNFFSIAGHDYELRRFFISHRYNSCPGDVGWLAVKDKLQDTCTWGTVQRFPAFLYAPGSHDLTWDGHGFREADVLAVFVKLRDNTNVTETCL